jgi:hypothetical protein
LAGGDEQNQLIDKFIESYIWWREQCAAVRSSYERWSLGSEHSDLAFAIYDAELEFEERAAHAYRESVERLALATRQQVIPSHR